jgi:hypothetical protein
MISDSTGTYVYNNLTVTGNIINQDLSNKLNGKASGITTAPATIILGQSSDFTYFVDEHSVSYPLCSSNDIVYSKNNNNISLNISQSYTDAINSSINNISLTPGPPGSPGATGCNRAQGAPGQQAQQVQQV